MARTSTVLGTVAAAAVASALLTAAPAGAATLRLGDPVGDVTRAPDVTRVTLRNGEHVVRVVVRLASAVNGLTVVSVDGRSGRGVLMAQAHTRRGDETDLAHGALTDRTGPGRDLLCPGARITRDEEAARIVFRLPSACLHGGDYGALRVAALTLALGTGELDLAPDQAPPEVELGGMSGSGWVPRG